jgi:hypothetical protein
MAMTKTIRILLASILTAFASANLWAQAPGLAPANGGDDIAARMAQLEAETRALRAEVQWLREHPVQQPEIPATPIGMNAPAPVPAPAPVYATMEQVKAEAKKCAWKKGDFTITPYGWLWGNAVDSSERTNPGSYTLWVLSANTIPESEFIVDARNTRLGFDVGGPQIPLFDGAKSGGKVEVDFQQNLVGTSTENRATVLLRHAYVEVKDDDFRLLAGQTWDVISPLYPGMLMYSVGWDGGNIGYRRAQFRWERYLKFSDVSLVTTQLSINQNVFSDATTTVRGEASNWPIVEGRVAWTVGQRGPGSLPVTVGVSGHIGEEEFDLVGAPDNRRRTWSANMDLRVPLTEHFGVQCEAYVGDNLDSFLGGIGQGTDPTTFNTIRDTGGWVEVWYDWTCRLHSHVGYSVDDPNNNDLHTVGERSYNQFYFGNLIFDVTKNFIMGLEVSSWKTLYFGQLPGDSIRTEFVVKYGF